MLSRAIQLHDGEEVIETIRRHWFHLAVEGGILLLVYLVLCAIILTTAISVEETALGMTRTEAILVGVYLLSLLGLMSWMRFFATWSDHWLDAWVITNKRIIDIEQHGFFRRQVSSFPLDRIQDVTFDISGIIAMWLHFGNIRIQTASISDDLILRQIPFPEDVKEHILLALEKAKAYSSGEG